MIFNSEKERIENFEELLTEYGDRISPKFKTWLINEGYFTVPASTKYHGSYEGGLYEHCYGVTNRLIELTKNNHLKWQKNDSPFIVGMFHDLCKYDQYTLVQEQDTNMVIHDGNGNRHFYTDFHYEYNKDTLLKGHGSKSVILLSQFINLTEEEMLCIRYHMGAYEKEEWSEFDLAIKKFENVLWVHQADQLASKIDGV